MLIRKIKAGILVVVCVVALYVGFISWQKNIDKLHNLTNKPLPYSTKISCTDLSDSALKNKCFEDLTSALDKKNGASCDRLTNDNDKMYCNYSEYVNLAMKEGSLSKCKELKTKNDQVNCDDMVNFSLAMRHQDQSFCQKIANEGYKSNCLGAIKKITPNFSNK